MGACCGRMWGVCVCACINMVSVKLTFPEQPKRCPWTEREYQSLLLHLEVFGPKWTVIGKSMHRSPSSVQHKLRRELDREWQREREQPDEGAEEASIARAQLRLIELALDLEPAQRDGATR